MKPQILILFSSLIGLSVGAGGSVGGSSGSSSIGRSSEYSGHHFVAAGEKFVITCTIDMSEYLQWTINGRAIIPGEAGYTMIEGPGPQGYKVSQLKVARAHPFHAGEYRCSPITTHSHSVFVISGSPTETENTRLFKKDHSLLLTCDYNATNVETVWKKNGTEIEPNDHYQIYNNSTLNITSQTESDLGEFSCLIKGPGEEEKYFYLVDLQLHKHLPKSTTVLENDKLKLSCLVEGNPHPNVQWLKDGEPLQPEENNTRLVFSANTYNVSNAILLIQPILKSDYGNYVCLISQYSLHLNTTTEVRVKDIYAALWPFLGIVAEVTILCAIIFIYEKRRIKPNLAQSDMDDINEQKNNADHSNETEVRQRK